jgi:hypothetical protein
VGTRCIADVDSYLFGLRTASVAGLKSLWKFNHWFVTRRRTTGASLRAATAYSACIVGSRGPARRGSTSTRRSACMHIRDSSRYYSFTDVTRTRKRACCGLRIRSRVDQRVPLLCPNRWLSTLTLFTIKGVRSDVSTLRRQLLRGPATPYRLRQAAVGCTHGDENDCSTTGLSSKRLGDCRPRCKIGQPVLASARRRTSWFQAIDGLPRVQWHGSTLR